MSSPDDPFAPPTNLPPAYEDRPADPWRTAEQGYGGSMTAYGPGAPAAASAPAGPVGTVRRTGVCILLAVVTLGFYTLYWYFRTHDEMKRHSGEGLGGGLALLIGFLVGIAMPYITSAEVGSLYARRGQRPPVSGLTGLWSFPGVLILVGPLVWFVKTNRALNAYWRSVGAPG